MHRDKSRYVLGTDMDERGVEGSENNRQTRERKVNILADA